MRAKEPGDATTFQYGIAANGAKECSYFALLGTPQRYCNLRIRDSGSKQRHEFKDC